MANYKTINMDFPTNPQNVALDKYNNQIYNFQPSPYKDLINGESDAVTRAKSVLESELGDKPTYSNNYQDKISRAIDLLSSNKPSDISPIQEKLYSEYSNNLNKAKADTIGQAIALMGGYKNGLAPAQAVSDQIYQQGLQNKDNITPELLELAYEMQQNDKNNAMNLLSAYNAQEQSEYGKYRDNMSDYQRALQSATDMLMRQEQRSRDIFNTDRAFKESAWENQKSMEQSAFETLQDRLYDQVQSDNANKLKANQQAWDNYFNIQDLNEKSKEAAFQEEYNNYQLWKDEQERIAAQQAAAAKAAASAAKKSSSNSEPIANYDYSQLSNSMGVKEFKKSVMSRDEFNRRVARTGAYNGYNTYSEYISDKIDSFKYGTDDNKYKLSDGEKLYLLDNYKIS